MQRDGGRVFHSPLLNLARMIWVCLQRCSQHSSWTMANESDVTVQMEYGCSHLSTQVADAITPYKQLLRQRLEMPIGAPHLAFPIIRMPMHTIQQGKPCQRCPKLP